MSVPLLLDTCALLWSAGADGRSDRLDGHLQRARAEDLDLWVSPITAWELGNLVDRKRIGLARPVLPWFEEMVARAGLKQTELTARVLAASTELPGDLNRDPADRIIVATAREFGMRLVTRDRRILDYADKGHVMALEC